MFDFKSNLENKFNYECQTIKFKLDSNTLAMDSHKGLWFAIFGPI